MILLLFFNPKPILSLQSPYTLYNLETTCGPYGAKQSLHLNSQAAVFVHNSSNIRKLDCHLELHLHSKALGFSIFIETLKIDASSGCVNDYLQFGRDKFVITTHTSKKYCNVIDHSRNVTDENGALIKYDFGDTAYAKREYIEIHDLEMDIWLQLQPAAKDKRKEVKLVVVPFRKSCDEDDEEYYKRCPRTGRCFRRQYFCSGLVKCDILSEEEEKKFCAKKNENSGIPYLPLIIIGILVLIILTIFIGFAIKMLIIHFKRDFESPERSTCRNSISPRNDERSPAAQAVTSLLTPEREQRRPTSQEIPLELHPLELPAHPPSYDEVVGIGYKDDPPKYSEITQVREG